MRTSLHADQAADADAAAEQVDEEKRHANSSCPNLN